MADLDFIEVVGRLGIVVGDTPIDADSLPDIQWADSGEIWFTPLNSVTKIQPTPGVPATLGQAPIKGSIDSQGYLVYNGSRSVNLVDLSSSKVNPRIDSNKATHRVEFRDIKSQGTPITLDSFNGRFASDTRSPSGTCDLTLLSPVPVSGGTATIQGPAGVSVQTLQVNNGQLEYTLTDGRTYLAGLLPAGPGGSDDGVASFLKLETSKSQAAAVELIGKTALAADAGLVKLAARGSVDAATSLAKSVRRFNIAKSITERWSDLSQWVRTGAFSVNAGSAYNDGLSGSQNWLVQDSLDIATGSRKARMKGTIRIPQPDGDGGSFLLIGGLRTAPGVAPNPGDFYGIRLGTGNGVVDEYTMGTIKPATLPDGTAIKFLVNATYQYEIQVDQAGVSIALYGTFGTPAVFFYLDRTQFDFRRFAILSTDPRKQFGAGIGPLVIRGDIVSSPTKTIEGTSPSLRWGRDGDDQPIHMSLPKNHDSRVPVPLVIMHHGYGGSELSIFNDSLAPQAYEGLLESGYAVLSINGGPYQGGNTFGNALSQVYIEKAYKWAAERYAIGPVLLWGVSMGGLVVSNALARRAIPNIMGVLYTYPALDIKSVWNNGNGDFAVPLRAAYNLTSDSQFDAATKAFDPMRQSVHAFRGVPMRFYASPQDEVALMSVHTTPFAAKMVAAGYDATVVQCTGLHGDPSHFKPSDYVDFFNRCIGQMSVTETLQDSPSASGFDDAGAKADFLGRVSF